jgi:hypothetical protein
MATSKLSLKYGLAAVIVALGIIGTSLYVNNTLNLSGQTTSAGQTSFFVMLTDPPTVPRGTTELNVSYSSVQLHVVSSSGSSNWVAAQDSGRVDLLSLVNMTQTIASVDLPTGSSVDKLQLKLSSAEAKIDGVVHPATLLSDNLLISMRETRLNGTKTGALIDLRPTLVQIDATNSTGGLTSYYVLSPSATAIVKSDISESQGKVGSRWRIGNDENNRLGNEFRRFSNNVTVTQSSLLVSGNVTTLSVTLKNVGNSNATLFSLTLGGEFNMTTPFAVKAPGSGPSGHGMPSPGNNRGGWGNMFPWPTNMGHPTMIPFAISDNMLKPIFGDLLPMASTPVSRLVLKPDESTTLTFSGVISLHVDGHGKAPHVAVTPVKGKSYTISLMGWGLKTFSVKAS